MPTEGIISVMPDDVLYRGRVRARVSRENGAFFTLKNGFSGIYAEVRPAEVKVSARHVPASLARLLGISYVISPEGAKVTEAEVGWMGTRLDSGPSLIVEAADHRGPFQLALRPLDGDLEALRRALPEAGAVI